jgi:hypothetical protein
MTCCYCGKTDHIGADHAGNAAMTGYQRTICGVVIPSDTSDPPHPTCTRWAGHAGQHDHRSDEDMARDIVRLAADLGMQLTEWQRTALVRIIRATRDAIEPERTDLELKA